MDEQQSKKVGKDQSHLNHKKTNEHANNGEWHHRKIPDKIADKTRRLNADANTAIEFGPTAKRLRLELLAPTLGNSQPSHRPISDWGSTCWPYQNL